MTLGAKHPWALARPASEVWAEIWPDIGPRIEHVLASGEATWDEGLLLFLERSGFPEETYHTFSYSPLHDDDGEVGGMFCVVTEDTTRVIGERRLGLLREFGTQLAVARDRLAGLGRAHRGPGECVAIGELARLAEQCEAVPRLIAVTGHGQEQDRSRSADAGFAAHLVKPVDMAALHALIEAESV